MSVAASVTSEARVSSSLDALNTLVAGDLRAVNELIIERMASPVAMIPQLAGHVVAAGGKRLRPMLTLASARMCGYEGRRHIALASCVEFIHTATLLHDDVVDHSELRRGLASANTVFGNKASVLVGDFLFSRAFELMVEDGSLEVLRILSRASSIIAEGEVMQLMTANNTQTDEVAYLDVIRAKTAQLFAAACEIGAVVAERSEQEQAALHSYGMNFGVAFQLVDDVLDYSAKQVSLGKTIGDDFREGKITLPVVLAFLRGDAQERLFWNRTMESLEQVPGDLDRAIGLMAQHNALADSMALARDYGAQASSALGILPDSYERQLLLDLIDFCIERAH